MSIADTDLEAFADLQNKVRHALSDETVQLALEAAYTLGRRRGVVESADMTKRMLGIGESDGAGEVKP